MVFNIPTSTFSGYNPIVLLTMPMQINASPYRDYHSVIFGEVFVLNCDFIVTGNGNSDSSRSTAEKEVKSEHG